MNETSRECALQTKKTAMKSNNSERNTNLTENML